MDFNGKRPARIMTNILLGSLRIASKLNRKNKTKLKEHVYLLVTHAPNQRRASTMIFGFGFNKLFSIRSVVVLFNGTVIIITAYHNSGARAITTIVAFDGNTHLNESVERKYITI